MIEEIADVIAKGYKPIIYIDTDLLSKADISFELRAIVKYAEVNKVKVIFTNEIKELNRLKKAYIFRYGYIPSITEAMIKRKQGIIVSGNLKI